ncbi:hypothetical protein CFP56_028375 [Quercus suber]|uniref:non-specific serine/threonine protein kinase n=1 Tax=Quercus suber TaxID=58331 RepID=A0AAW0JTF0_QUESU
MQSTLTPYTPFFKLRILTLLLLQLQILPTLTLSPCRTSCGNVAIKYPFGLDDGCGAPQFRHMFNCTTDLFFTTPSGVYKVQSIDYDKKTMVVYDPAMSTCSILQPHHDFVMTDIQSVIIPPSPDTIFVLLNCSIDSPVLNHYKNLCFNFSGHSCDELYGSCNAFRLFHLLTNSTPPCCFTGYDTVKYMSMNILDCTHYTTVINSDNLKGIGPLDWVYGIKLSFTVAETGCERCAGSGGTCGFDTETVGFSCLCSTSMNATRECESLFQLFGTPPCCFTGYDTVKYMSMNILDCTHYTTVINSDNLKGIGPLDWVYGIKLSFTVAETGCERCAGSGGTCGFDTETVGFSCLCSTSMNATRECGPLDWVYGIKLSFTVAETGCERCAGSGGTCGFDTETVGFSCLCSTSMNATRECVDSNGFVAAARGEDERGFGGAGGWVPSEAPYSVGVAFESLE